MSSANRFADLFFSQTLQQQFNTLGLHAANQNKPHLPTSTIFKK